MDGGTVVSGTDRRAELFVSEHQTNAASRGRCRANLREKIKKCNNVPTKSENVIIENVNKCRNTNLQSGSDLSDFN